MTDRRTGSAAEGFAFAFQKLKKATVVGDTTGGAGIGTIVAPLCHGLYLLLPVKMLMAPGMTQGLEGKGVIPDVIAREDDVLEIIKRMISENKQ